MSLKKPRTYINERGEMEGTLAFSEKLEDELCDFCANLNPPYKVYPCADFPHPMAPMQWSRGEWNACLKCAELVDAGDREGLLQRSILMHEMEWGPTDETAEMIVREFHNGFFANRKDK